MAIHPKKGTAAATITAAVLMMDNEIMEGIAVVLEEAMTTVAGLLPPILGGTMSTWATMVAMVVTTEVVVTTKDATATVVMVPVEMSVGFMET